MNTEMRAWSQGVREWLRANALASAVHHEEQVQRMRRMAGARAAGLDPVHFDVPFPGTSVEKNEVNNFHLAAPGPPPDSIPGPAPALTKPGMSLLGKAGLVALGIVMALLLLAAGAAAVYFLTRHAQPVPEWGFQVKVGDGQWGPWHPLPKGDSK